MTNKVYIVEEMGWDHHENIAVFSTIEAAEQFCDDRYGKPEGKEYWVNEGYSYWIRDYVLQ